MALEQYAVQLTPEGRERLSQLIRSGKKFGAHHRPSAHPAESS